MTFNIAVFAAECVASGLTKSQAKEQLERLGHGSLRSQLSPLMRGITGEAKPRPNYAQRQAAARLREAVIETPEQAAAIEAAFVASHSALIAAGAVMDAESSSGSRYYTMPSGIQVRVADHDANDATRHWMDGGSVEQIRVDGRGWKNALETLIDG